MMRSLEAFEVEFDVLRFYQEKSKIEELTKIISDPALDMNERETQCRNLIEEMNRNKEENTNGFKNIVLNNSEMRNQGNFDIMNSIKRSILSLIGKLNFFENKFKQP